MYEIKRLDLNEDKKMSWLSNIFRKKKTAFRHEPQGKDFLEDWYKNPDPYGFMTCEDDKKRQKILLSILEKFIPEGKKFRCALDIGCGQGFMTEIIPANEVTGIDISENAVKTAIKNAKEKELGHIKYSALSLFDVYKLKEKYDFIMITGVMYDIYTNGKIYEINELIDNVLEKEGILVSVHIKDHYHAAFPYEKLTSMEYPYREYIHLLEVYKK